MRWKKIGLVTLPDPNPLGRVKKVLRTRDGQRLSILGEPWLQVFTGGVFALESTALAHAGIMATAKTADEVWKSFRCYELRL